MASEAYLGGVFLFAGTFAPRGYASCEGQLLPISQNTALFSILGTTYGGNGTSNFALPDLRGRAPIGQGTGPGLQTYVSGENGGVESVTLNTNQLPSHTHPLSPNYSSPQTTDQPSGALPAPNGAYSTAAPAGTMAGQNTGSAGGNQPHENRAPFLAMYYIIALQGIFPSRN